VAVAHLPRTADRGPRFTLPAGARLPDERRGQELARERHSYHRLTLTPGLRTRAGGPHAGGPRADDSRADSGRPPEAERRHGDIQTTCWAGMLFYGGVGYLVSRLAHLAILLPHRHDRRAGPGDLASSC